jgi:acid stress-induced BolA-like protein IbaG/YrbA
MTERERYKEMLTRSMEGHLESPQVEVMEGEPFRFQGNIVSPTFEGMEDWERQELVWGRVYATFNEEDRQWLDFIFTNSPAEMAAYAEANEQTADQAGNPS